MLADVRLNQEINTRPNGLPTGPGLLTIKFPDNAALLKPV